MGIWYVYLGVKEIIKFITIKVNVTGVFKAPDKENINSEQVVLSLINHFKSDGSVEL